MLVLKRDGTSVPFDKDKIIKAINAAFMEVDGQLYETDTAADIAKEIEETIERFYNRNLNLEMGVSIQDVLAEMEKLFTVEQIQDLIEEYLMRSERRDVARAYIRFRYKREVARERSSEFIQAIKEKLEAKNVANQNANVDEQSFGGRMGEASSYLTKDYALNYIISKMAKENHLNNMIYIHDLDSYAVGSHNCLSIPFDDLLANGFNTRQTDVRPAGSVNTAFQLVAVIFQLQSLQQFGGVSATHLDWTMVPYVRKSFYKHYKEAAKWLCRDWRYLDWDEEKKLEIKIGYDSSAYGAERLIDLENIDVSKTSIKDPIYTHHTALLYEFALEMTKREIYQAAEGLYHNLNTLQSRSGNQLPFTSINYGTCTLPEGRLITEALLNVSIEGLGKNKKTSIFPCGIFQVMKGVNKEPGTPNYDLYRLALKSTAQRLYPNYANVDWSGNVGYDINDPTTYFSTMGKRKLSPFKIF